MRFIQTVGIFDPAREGSRRILEDVGYPWPWARYPNAAQLWTDWWRGSKVALGQTASEMFTWYLISQYRAQIDAILRDQDRLAENLRLTFRGTTDEVLDIACAHLRFEDSRPDEPRLMPGCDCLRDQDFPRFAEWWHKVRLHCGAIANVAKHRAIALFIPALAGFFTSSPSSDQWTLIERFLGKTRDTARELAVEFPEPRGKWRKQREQFDGFDRVAEVISQR